MNNMQDTKFWLDSTTVRGALVTILPAAALFFKAFDVNLGEGEQRVANFILRDATELQGVSVYAQSGVKGNTFLASLNAFLI